MSEGHDLEILFQSHLPIILIEPHKETRILALISRIGIKHYIRPHLGRHCCITFLGKGAAITCETCLALMAQVRPRC
ncbi:MAG: hypothetical protein K0A95_03030 [Chromatiales bacterium]|nr:hypothetical protein [Gammaproteobacteria bacterium]MBW6476031.1 hypothetical protein [Chromatiales bacterium]